MNYADIYGASDDTGPSSAVAGSMGYVAAQEAEAALPTRGEMIATEHTPAPGIAGLVELGHELLDSPAGLAFLVGGLVLLVLWRELAD